jgi:hypothetical protein
MRHVWWQGILMIFAVMLLLFSIGGLVGYQIGRAVPARAILVGGSHQEGGSWSCVYQREAVKPNGLMDHPRFYDSAITK